MSMPVHQEIYNLTQENTFFFQDKSDIHQTQIPIQASISKPRNEHM